MTPQEAYKSDLINRLQVLRDSVLWKLDGLTEYDIRRPLTPTGTNLLGLVKHLAACEFGYFGYAFGRPAPIELPWALPGTSVNADMWAAPDESTDLITNGLYRRSWEHAGQTFEALDLDAPGFAPGWPEPHVTLHQILVHMNIETARHAGHADIVREMIDGAAGMTKGNDNLPYTTDERRRAHFERVQAAAATFR
ncbi:DinB family protein [Rhodococcus sp. UNC363MFTsu5.1]|uniref:DinB family protein n=1 Tax=Rhodococcus sp. UNC363MFTsu5.1 TaxID=1449069 RepID=UPI0004890BC6|nr:DinB family protein [Rhodococcus sp. UNC363MFTsu5.1]